MSVGTATLTTKKLQRKQKTEKLPALHFYPGDWKKDVAVQSLDPMARYVWFECLLLMHDSEERGVLVLNGKPMTIDQISRAINLDKQITSKSLEEVRDSGVCDVREDGAIINRRMVRDEAIRQERIKAGLKGGNPSLLKQNSSKSKKQGYLSSKQNPEDEYEDENEDVIEIEDPKKEVDEIGQIKKPPHCQMSVIDFDQFRATKGDEFLDRCFEKANAWVEEARGTPDFNNHRRRAQNCSALFQNWVFNAVEEERERKASRQKPTKESDQDWFDKKLQEIAKL